MRRLVVLCCAVVLVDTMLYAALTPLLPELAERFDLSKSGTGILVAAFAVGALLGSLPSGLAAARLGPKAAVLLGLALMSVASLGFALAGTVWGLGAARFVQGMGSTLSWAGASTWLVASVPRGQRGQILGTAISAAVVGALIGPVLGAAASVAGIASVFAGVGAVGACLIVWTATMPAAEPDPQPLRALWPVISSPRFLGGLWLLLLPALLFGVLSVLVPLELSAAGLGAVAIGAVFLVGAGLEAFMHPFVGRLSDRRGRLLPMEITLAASVLVSLGLAISSTAAAVVAFSLAAFLAYGGFFAPASAYISDVADRSGLAQGLAFGVLNGAWALGNAVGPPVGGGLADVAGDAVPFLISAGISLATLAVLRSAGTLLPGVPKSS